MCPGGNGMRQSFIVLIFSRLLSQHKIIELISLLLRSKKIMRLMHLWLDEKWLAWFPSLAYPSRDEYYHLPLLGPMDMASQKICSFAVEFKGPARPESPKFSLSWMISSVVLAKLAWQATSPCMLITQWLLYDGVVEEELGVWNLWVLWGSVCVACWDKCGAESWRYENTEGKGGHLSSRLLGVIFCLCYQTNGKNCQVLGL